MGTASLADARLSGELEVSGAQARLISNVDVAVRDHTAPIALTRGGKVLVCATSEFHLLRSGAAGLLFGLDRGAVEIQSPSQPQDAILTPDLRFTLLTRGPLDVKLRVTREGDTCVENRGDTAPVLQVSETFGTAMYYLAPGQHVLFEHGSVRTVVDKERSDCGCPAATLARATAYTGNGTSAVTPQQAAALNPFPVAQSADLAPVKPSVPLPDRADATLKYSAAKSPETAASPVAIPEAAAAPASAATPAAQAPTQAVSTEPPPAPPGAHDMAHAIGGFFRRIFHRKAK